MNATLGELVCLREKRHQFYWAGLVIFGVSLYFFLTAIWQFIFFYYIYSFNPSGFSSQSLVSLVRTEMVASASPIIGGVIFAVIGIHMMRAGVRKEKIPPQQTEQPHTTT